MDQQYDAVFFMGAQGAGKGTQAHLLAGKLNFFHWDMGAILRQIAKEPTDLGRRVERLIYAGQLLPDELILPVVQTEMARLPQNQGIIFDGFPRVISQLDFLLSHLKTLNKTRLATVYIHLPKEESVKRLLERAHHEFRKDDTLEKIVIRLTLFEKATMPVLTRMQEVTQFFQIDGTPSVAEVEQQIDKALGL